MERAYPGDGLVDDEERDDEAKGGELALRKEKGLDQRHEMLQPRSASISPLLREDKECAPES